jgi:hypothetical protein
MNDNNIFFISFILFFSFLLIGFIIKLSRARQELLQGDEKIRELESRVAELERIIRTS